LPFLAGGSAAVAQGAPLPWGQSSDLVGWETYVAVTAPSGAPTGNNVEFETWATDEDIYKANPPKWPVGSAPKMLHPSVLLLSQETGIRPLSIEPGACSDLGPNPLGGFPPHGCIGEEVRRNWASFQYIVGNNLYTKDGLAAFAKSNAPVNMPADSIEVKANWVKLTDLKTWLKNTIKKDLTDDQIKNLYHVNVVSEATGEVEYALVAFHFSSKQIKNWVWSDFEHELNPGRCDDTGCHDSFGAEIRDVPAKNSRGAGGTSVNENQDYGSCVKSDAVEKMMSNAGLGPQWRHYCMKGTQIDFVGADGTTSTILGNSVIERISAKVPILKSSCVTCHAYASFKSDGSTHRPPSGPLGKPSLEVGYIQNDFVWGIFLPLRQN
jgi:hypothetical protein